MSVDCHVHLCGHYWERVKEVCVCSLQSWHICDLFYKWMVQGWCDSRESYWSFYPVTFIKLWTWERLGPEIDQIRFQN